MSHKFFKNFLGHIKVMFGGFLDGSVVKNLLATAGDTDSLPDPGRSTCCRATKPVFCNY